MLSALSAEARASIIQYLEGRDNRNLGPRIGLGQGKHLMRLMLVMLPTVELAA